MSTLVGSQSYDCEDVDGDFHTASFEYIGSVNYDQEGIVYAVTGKKTVRLRVIDLKQKRVSTLMDSTRGKPTVLEECTTGLAPGHGVLYFSATDDHYIYSVDLKTGAWFIAMSLHSRSRLSVGEVNLIAGGLQQRGFRDGDLKEARFCGPGDLDFDKRSNSILVSDHNNHRIRRICLNTNTVSTVCGSGSSNYSDGPALECGATRPTALICDGGTGNVIFQTLLVTPKVGHVVRLYDAATGAGACFSVLSSTCLLGSQVSSAQSKSCEVLC